MSATCSNKVGTGPTKDQESCVHLSIHPSSTGYLKSGRRVASSSRGPQTSLALVTLTVTERSQARVGIKSLHLVLDLPVALSQLDMPGTPY